MKDIILKIIKVLIIIAIIAGATIIALPYINGDKSKQIIDTDELSSSVNKKIEDAQTNYDNFEKKIQRKQEVVEF